MSTMKFVIQNYYTRMLYKNVIQNMIHNLTTFKKIKGTYMDTNIGYIYRYIYIIYVHDIQNHKTSFHILVTNFHNALIGQLMIHAKIKNSF